MENVQQKESEKLEFKETLAEINEAGEALCGFANQTGGILYFGVRNNGKVLGLKNVVEKTLRDITNTLVDNMEPKMPLSVTEEANSGVTVIKIIVSKSSSPIHTFKGRPYIRMGPTTKKMSQNEYQRRLLYHQTVNKDYSSNILPEAKMEDLSVVAIKELRQRLKNSGRYKTNIEKMTTRQLLKNLLLLRDQGLTIAAMVLLAKEDSLARYLPYCEIRYGYRAGDDEIRNQDMEIFKGGYLLYYMKLWGKIDSRNINISVPYKMRLIEKKAFDGETIREAINNTVIHRDYLISGSTLVIQYPYRIVMTSQGGFPDGVTIENIINETRPRNKLIADILFKCEMVEQFGSGVNLMYKNQLSLGKLPPNYHKSDESYVKLELDGKIQDEEFAKYVLTIAEERNKNLNDKELIILNRIKNNKKIESGIVTDNLLELELIEKIGTNKYMLSKQYYVDTEQRWKYTKKRGLSNARNSELILQHLRNFGPSRKEDFLKLFQFTLTDKQVNWLLTSLKKDKKIKFAGLRRSRSAKWEILE
ncbi:MAG: RNA-binding domain-containing protein [Patescibacteria group bacterium]|nr:putative DNA binding domain-containing protein [Patescibacteria group bacterium]